MVLKSVDDEAAGMAGSPAKPWGPRASSAPRPPRRGRPISAAALP